MRVPMKKKTVVILALAFVLAGFWDGASGAAVPSNGSSMWPPASMKPTSTYTKTFHGTKLKCYRWNFNHGTGYVDWCAAPVLKVPVA